MRAASPPSPALTPDQGRRREGQDDPAAQDRERQSFLAADQVLAVSAPGPRPARRLSRPRRRRGDLRRARRGRAARRRARPRGDRGLHHLGRPRLRHRQPVPRPGRPRLPRRPAPDRAPLRGGAVRRHGVPGPRRGHLAPISSRLPRRPPGPHLPVARAHPRGRAGAATRPRQAPALPGAQLARRVARLPAPLRLLLQGVVLLGWPLVLPAAAQRRPDRDRAIAGSSPLLPGRQPLRQPALRERPLRRHARHGPRLAGRRHGTGGAAARPPRAGRHGRLPQPVHRLRDAERRQPARPAQAAEPGPRGGRRRIAASVRGRDPPPPRPRRHGQRELRLRHGRRRPLRLCAHGRLGCAPGHPHGHVPHPHALPRNGLEPPPGRRGPHSPLRLGSLRHQARSLSAGAHDGGPARGRLPARLPRVLRLARHRAFRLGPGRGRRPPSSPRLHGRLEEDGAVVGPRHPPRPRPASAAAARDAARRAGRSRPRRRPAKRPAR